MVSSDKLQEVDTDNVAPMTHPLQLFNVMREDVPTDVLDREEMLKSVKEHEDWTNQSADNPLMNGFKEEKK